MMKLPDYAFNVFSQFGEDGIIQKVFEILGTSSKVCIEIGAWDGLYLSNTANLWTKGWKGILIESDRDKFLALLENVKNYDCRCIFAKVTHEGINTIENLLKREGLFGPVDLLSIDVDGDDYYIFHSMNELRPRVVICEYNPTIPINLELVPYPDNYFGCSAPSLVKLAETKGYKLISMTESNCFFVQDLEFNRFSAYETSLESLAITKHLTYLMTGYAGDYVASRMPTYGCTRPSTEQFTGQYFKFPTATSFTNGTNSVRNKSLLQKNTRFPRIIERINRLLTAVRSLSNIPGKIRQRRRASEQARGTPSS